MTKLTRVLQEEGLMSLLKRGGIVSYNQYIAPLLPTSSAIYNGVEVDAARIFDSNLPWRNKNKPDYESGLVHFINNHIQKNDNVVIVGGGWGVTAVKAASKVGSNGNIIVYECSLNEVKKVEETIHRHSVSDRVVVNHALVGPLVSTRGPLDDASRVKPCELPKCDVLELDCEGSEIEILQNLSIRPRVIIVESHGHNGASSTEIKNKLVEYSYSIESEEVADAGEENFCIDNDIYVITAILD